MATLYLVWVGALLVLGSVVSGQIQDDQAIVISDRNSFLRYFDTEIHWEIKDSGPVGGLPLQPSSQYFYITRDQGQDDDGSEHSEFYHFIFNVEKHICNSTTMEFSIKYCNFDTRTTIWPIQVAGDSGDDFHTLKSHHVFVWDYEQFTVDISLGVVEIAGILDVDTELLIDEIVLWHDGNYDCLPPTPTTLSTDHTTTETTTNSITDTTMEQSTTNTDLTTLNTDHSTTDARTSTDIITDTTPISEDPPTTTSLSTDDPFTTSTDDPHTTDSTTNDPNLSTTSHPNLSTSNAPHTTDSTTSDPNLSTASDPNLSTSDDPHTTDSTTSDPNLSTSDDPHTTDSTTSDPNLSTSDDPHTTDSSTSDPNLSTSTSNEPGLECSAFSHSMSECLKNGCSFCTSNTYTGFLCDTYANLEQNECKGICGEPAINVMVDPELVSSRQTLTLCPNENKTFTVTFNLQSHPVDVYVLLDLSGSMADDREKLIQLSSQLLAAVQNMTDDYRLGYGSHVDKPWFNFGSHLYGDYSFRNHLRLANLSEGEFSSAVSGALIKDGGDTAESQLDAMFQIAKCTSEIGWRNNSRHVLLLLTDARYHKSPDGIRYGLQPFNRACSLNGDGLYTGEVTYDYPSEQDIINVFSEENITPIFGVTEFSTRHYENLQRNIPNSAIGVLNTDSSNVVELLVDEYKKIEQRTTLERVDQDDGSLNIRYFSSCNGDTVEETTICDELSANGTVTFTISINLKDCPVTRNPDDEKLVRIQPKGSPTQFEVAFKTICTEHWE